MADFVVQCDVVSEDIADVQVRGPKMRKEPFEFCSQTSLGNALVHKAVHWIRGSLGIKRANEKGQHVG